MILEANTVTIVTKWLSPNLKQTIIVSGRFW